MAEGKRNTAVIVLAVTTIVLAGATAYGTWYWFRMEKAKKELDANIAKAGTSGSLVVPEALLIKPKK